MCAGIDTRRSSEAAAAAVAPAAAAQAPDRHARCVGWLRRRRLHGAGAAAQGAPRLQPAGFTHRGHAPRAAADARARAPSATGRLNSRQVIKNLSRSPGGAHARAGGASKQMQHGTACSPHSACSAAPAGAHAVPAATPAHAEGRPIVRLAPPPRLRGSRARGFEASRTQAREHAARRERAAARRNYSRPALCARLPQPQQPSPRFMYCINSRCFRPSKPRARELHRGAAAGVRVAAAADRPVDGAERRGAARYGAPAAAVAARHLRHGGGHADHRVAAAGRSGRLGQLCARGAFALALY